MTSAIELSVRFGIPTGKIEELCEFIGFHLSAEQFASHKEFERVARAVKRGRSSAGTIAFIYSEASEDERDFVFALDPAFQSAYEAAGMPVVEGELLPNAKKLLSYLESDAATNARPEWQELAAWVKMIVEGAKLPVGHNYIAVRLLLSLPENVRAEYPGKIASILNKLRHRGYLAGWFETRRFGDAGKNFIAYSVPATARAADLGLTDADIDKFKTQLGSSDIVKLAGLISFKRKLAFNDVKLFLENRKTWLDL